MLLREDAHAQSHQYGVVACVKFNQHSDTSCSQPDNPFTDHLDQPSASTVKLGSANMVVKRSISSFLAASVVKKHGGVRGMCI